MNDNELWSAIIGVLAAIIVRVLDYYFPGIGRVTETQGRPPSSSTEGRHRGTDQEDNDDASDSTDSG